MKESTNGVGASISFLSDESAVSLTVGTVSGEYAIRQSRHIPYIPGKSQQTFSTAVMAEAKENVVQRIGYFDEDDGLFFELNGSGLSVVVRTSTSGSAVDTGVSQSNWNIDTLDGTGPSKKTLDITKSQIFVIDFQWLGVGRIRYGFDIDGILYYVHEIFNANNLDKVYMKSGSLPLRYEIRNTGTSASETSLKEICCTCNSEGGFQIPGLSYSMSNKAVARDTTTTLSPILAIRLKSIFNGKKNRRTIRFTSSSALVTGATHYLELHHVHNPSSITASWVDVNSQSGVEYSVDVTAITGNPSHVIKSGWAVTGSPGSSSAGISGLESGIVNEHGLVTQNIDSDNSQIFAIYARTLTGTGTAYAEMEWLEFE